MTDEKTKKREHAAEKKEKRKILGFKNEAHTQNHHPHRFILVLSFPSFPTTRRQTQQQRGAFGLLKKNKQEEEREKIIIMFAALGTNNTLGTTVVSSSSASFSNIKRRRSNVKCAASSSERRHRSDKVQNNFNEKKQQTRREVMKFAALAPALFSALPAMAILQGNDEEDEAFLAKAKANRNAKLQDERSKQAKYAGEKLGRSTGDVAALQLAVYKISKAGSLIDQDSIYGAGAELESGNWEKELAKSEFGTDALTSTVGALKKACASGDANGAKKAYVSTASALKEAANAAGVAAQLKKL